MGERQAKLNINFSSSRGIVGKGATERKKPKACENRIVYFLTKQSFCKNFVNQILSLSQ